MTAKHDGDRECPADERSEQARDIDLDAVEVRELEHRQLPPVRTGLRGGWLRRTFN